MNKYDISFVDNNIFVKIYKNININDVNIIVQKINCISNLYKIININLELENDVFFIEYLKKSLYSSNSYYKIKTYNYIVE